MRSLSPHLPANRRHTCVVGVGLANVRCGFPRRLLVSPEQFKGILLVQGHRYTYQMVCVRKFELLSTAGKNADAVRNLTGRAS